MGKNNVEAVFTKASEGYLMRTTKNKKGVEIFTLDNVAVTILTLMANESYDWPPTQKQVAEHVPCRAYERGLDYIADMMGYGNALTAQEVQDLDLVQVQDLMQRKHDDGVTYISKIITKLVNAGLVEVVREARSKSSDNKYAAYLLLIGDDVENEKVRQWWADCVDAGWGRRRRPKRPNIVDPYANQEEKQS
ncbi:hypothetical protein [Bifidobacterium cuniculi]|nr:hypothetical protein [Bifidobacterium cuniculi]